MSVLLDLAERCEAATGPDRVLNADIARVLQHGRAYAAGDRAWNFTGSFDAALTLVPNCWFVLKLSESRKRDRCVAALGKRGTHTETEWSNPECRSLALALCAVALRAHAASAIEARRAATAETGAVHESAVGAAETPTTSRGTSHG